MGWAERIVRTAVNLRYHFVHLASLYGRIIILKLNFRCENADWTQLALSAPNLRCLLVIKILVTKPLVSEREAFPL